MKLTNTVNKGLVGGQSLERKYNFSNFFSFKILFFSFLSPKPPSSQLYIFSCGSLHLWLNEQSHVHAQDPNQRNPGLLQQSARTQPLSHGASPQTWCSNGRVVEKETNVFNSTIMPLIKIFKTWLFS